mgnify:FL=1
MNWGKIKTMFIYVFIVLNIILLSFFIYTVEKNSDDIVQEKEIIEKSMANDNITVEENYTKKDNLGYVNVTISDLKDIKQDIAGLNYDLTKSDKTAILKVTSEASLTNVNKNNYKVDLDTFLLERFKPSANYIFSSYDSNKKEIIYDQQVDGLRIFSNNNARIVFHVDDNGDVKSFEQTLVTNIRKDKNEILVTQSQAVNRLYHEDLIPKNSKVKANLGYYTYISQTENQVLIPTWNIVISNNDSGEVKNYYVDAINLDILNKKQ